MTNLSGKLLSFVYVGALFVFVLASPALKTSRGLNSLHLNYQSFLHSSLLHLGLVEVFSHTTSWGNDISAVSAGPLSDHILDPHLYFLFLEH